jgi:surface protein
MPDFGIFRGFNDKLFGDKLYAGQLPTQLGIIGSQQVQDLKFFNFTVKTDNLSTGSSTSTQFKMPLTTSTGLNMQVDWGDGSAIETITNHTLAIHTYATAGTYNISVTGDILGWKFAGSGDRLKMLNISKWEGFKITDQDGFFGCENLTCTATDAPIITTTNLNNYFRVCRVFNGAIGNWNTSTVTSMNTIFFNAQVFNQPIGTWDTSNVTTMAELFLSAPAFNQNIGAWNVSKVTNFADFMSNKTALTYSAANLDALYNGWSSRAVIANRSISFGSAKYTAAGVAGRLLLTSAPNNWTITDGGI